MNSNPKPGDGLRSLKTTNLFRVVNFELYTKPNAVLMGIGLVTFAICFGYISYMRYNYESKGYTVSVKKDDTEEFTLRKSKWD